MVMQGSVPLACWLLRCSLHRGRLSTKSAKPLLNQTLVQPPLLLPTVIDSLADSAVSCLAFSHCRCQRRYEKSEAESCRPSKFMKRTPVTKHTHTKKNLSFFLVLSKGSRTLERSLRAWLFPTKTPMYGSIHKEGSTCSKDFGRGVSITYCLM